MMLALSQAQGIVLVIGGLIFLLVAGVALFARRGVRRADQGPDIPRAMRPGPSDADLETPNLQKLQAWGVVLVIFLVVWLPMAWVSEPNSNLAQEKDLLTDSIARGEAAVQLFTEENQGGIGCVRCHGGELQGSRIIDPATGTVVPTPNLTTVCGGPSTGHTLIFSLADIRAVVERGRGEIMPSWSVRYAGPLNDQQITDILNYIVSIQSDEVTFANNVCLNPEATAKFIESELGGDLTQKPPPANVVVGES
jgi:mono/diheme cytochrome c family protein